MSNKYFRNTNKGIEIVMCECCKHRFATEQIEIANPISDRTERWDLCDSCRYYIINVIAKTVNNGIKPRYEE